MERQVARMVKVFTVLGVLLTAAVPLTRAGGFELTPIVGYHFGGELNDIDTEGVDQLEIRDSDSWGVVLGFRTSTETLVEVLYSRQSTTLVGQGSSFASGEETVADLEVDIWHIGGVYEVPSGRKNLRPFAGFSLGATNYSPSGGLDSLTRFSVALYGGGKFDLGSHVGIRLQARWTPTFITSDTAVFCNSLGGCYVVGSSEIVSDIELSAGLMLRF